VPLAVWREKAGKTNRHTPQTGADRSLGARWSAGLEEDRARDAQPVTGIKPRREALEVRRQRQNRRLRGERGRGEEDRGADRAIVVGITGALSGIMAPRFLLRLCKRDRVRADGRLDDCGVRTSPHRIDMRVADVNMPKREHDLQRQRRKSQPGAAAPMQSYPSHGQRC